MNYDLAHLEQFKHEVSWFSSVGLYISCFHEWIPDDSRLIPLCFRRKAQYRRIGGMSLPGAVSPSSPERSVSRDSMEDYWSEMKNIQEDCQERHEELTERASADGAYRRSVLTPWDAFPPSGRAVEQRKRWKSGYSLSQTCMNDFPPWMQKVMFSKSIMWSISYSDNGRDCWNSQKGQKKSSKFQGSIWFY